MMMVDSKKNSWWVRPAFHVKLHCRRSNPLPFSALPSPMLPHTLYLRALVFLCVSGSRWTGWRCPGQTYASAATEWLNMRETNTTSPTHRGTVSVSRAAPRLRVPIDPRRCCLTITQMILATVSISVGESFDYAALQRVHYQSHSLNISVSHREICETYAAEDQHLHISQFVIISWRPLWSALVLMFHSLSFQVDNEIHQTFDVMVLY